MITRKKITGGTTTEETITKETTTEKVQSTITVILNMYFLSYNNCRFIFRNGIKLVRKYWFLCLLA